MPQLNNKNANVPVVNGGMVLMHLKSHDTGKSCGDTITLPTIGFLCHFSDLLVVKRLDTDQATDGYSRLRVIASPRLIMALSKMQSGKGEVWFRNYLQSIKSKFVLVRL